ncbi:Uncharacterised protein [Vibrio cholerae]|nr:Uncharacterised protein [Vibrio cholerae]
MPLSPKICLARVCKVASLSAYWWISTISNAVNAISLVICAKFDRLIISFR